MLPRDKERFKSNISSVLYNLAVLVPSSFSSSTVGLVAPSSQRHLPSSPITVMSPQEHVLTTGIALPAAPPDLEVVTPGPVYSKGKANAKLAHLGYGRINLTTEVTTNPDADHVQKKLKWQTHNPRKTSPEAITHLTHTLLDKLDLSSQNRAINIIISRDWLTTQNLGQLAASKTWSNCLSLPKIRLRYEDIPDGGVRPMSGNVSQ